MKKGLFALSKTAELILLVIGLIVLIFFAYFLRDKIVEFIDYIIGFVSP
jgi:hypothetical protein